MLGSPEPESWLFQRHTERTYHLPDPHRAGRRPSFILQVRPKHPSRTLEPAGVTRGSSLLIPPGPLACLETATAGELNFVQQQVLITSAQLQTTMQPADTLNPETIDKVVKAVAENIGTGAFVIPADVTAQRLGPEPPDQLPIASRIGFENSLLALHGIPPALVSQTGTGQAMREGFRQVLHALLKPLGALVVAEIQEKLDPAAGLDFSALRASDIAGAARAYGSLVTSGITPQSAAVAVGLEGVDVREVSP